MFRAMAFPALAALAISASIAAAENYPSRPVRIIVPFPPGGSTDVMARIVADHLRENLGQPFIVFNRGGASGNLGTEMAAKSAPDGYTLLMASPGPQVTNQFIYSNMRFNSDKDFVPVVLVTTLANVLTVHPSLGIRTVPQLIERARAKPGKLNYGTAGVGTAAQLAAVLFAKMADIDIVHIPFTGTSHAVHALLAGQVDMMFNSIPAMLPHINEGTTIALGVSTSQRAAVLPNVPTIASYLPGYETNSWLALVAPTGTPSQAINVLNAEVNRMLQNPEIKQKLAIFGADPGGGSPQELAKLFSDETTKWRKIIPSAGIKME